MSASVFGSMLTNAMKRPSRDQLCGNRVWAAVPNRRSASPAAPTASSTGSAVCRRRREREGRRVRRPDRRRLVDSAERRSGRRAARRVEEPDPRRQVEPIDRGLPPISREGDVHVSSRAIPSVPDGRAVAAKPRRLGDASGRQPSTPPCRSRTPRTRQPDPACSTPSATRIGSPVNSRRFEVEPLGHKRAVVHEKEQVGRTEAMHRCRNRHALRSAESSEATKVPALSPSDNPEHEVTAVGQEQRHHVTALLPRRIQHGDRCRRASGRRHPE